jgi:hypothetical protein
MKYWLTDWFFVTCGRFKIQIFVPVAKFQSLVFILSFEILQPVPLGVKQAKSKAQLLVGVQQAKSKV